MKRSGCELADVFCRFGPSFMEQRGKSLSWQQQNAIAAVEACRTAAMGGHQEQCNSCGRQAQAYNSCRNRHCPKCQGSAQAQWSQAREDERLPTGYFHVVFTLPQSMARLALQNQSVMYDLLFRATAATLKEVAANPKHLGARIGFFAVLHTWGQRMEHHPHLHCVIPAGGLSPDGKQWIHCKQSRTSGKLFFLPVAILSQVFRGKYLELLRQAYLSNKLSFFGDLKSLHQPREFERFLDASVKSNWVVYVKESLSGSSCVIRYLARYTHRIAISNSRLLGIEGDQVAFRWKNYRSGGSQEVMRLDGLEFMRRFLQHVLPKGFTRIRHFGILGNRVRKQTLRRCRDLLGNPPEVIEKPEKSTGEIPTATEEGNDSKRCPTCKSGRMLIVASWERGQRMPAPRTLPLQVTLATRLLERRLPKRRTPGRVPAREFL